MAVVRITAPKKWHLRASDALWDFPRARRELLRAAARPGLTAELRGDELRALVARWPDSCAIEALGELEASEKRERERPRARDVMMAKFKEAGVDPGEAYEATKKKRKHTI